MRFTHEGSLYEILFSRDHKMIEIIDREKNEKREEFSKFPHTSVFILKVDERKRQEHWEVVATEEVGCYKKDRFDLEEGRVWALKKVTTQIYHISPKMVASMWESYNNRPKLGDLREQNHKLRQEVAKLKELNAQLVKLADTALVQAQDMDNRFMQSLQEGV